MADTDSFNVRIHLQKKFHGDLKSIHMRLTLKHGLHFSFWHQNSYQYICLNCCKTKSQIANKIEWQKFSLLKFQLQQPSFSCLVSVATNDLPAPNKFISNQEQRTNQDIFSAMRSFSCLLFSYNHQGIHRNKWLASTEQVQSKARATHKPQNSFQDARCMNWCHQEWCGSRWHFLELRATKVRPLTAKGERVRKHPRHLETTGDEPTTAGATTKGEGDKRPDQTGQGWIAKDGKYNYSGNSI